VVHVGAVTNSVGLPWSRWHWLVVSGLGITWILDGFEVTLVGAIASMLTHKDALGLTTRQAASAGTFYLVGAIAGAFIFGLRQLTLLDETD
jgi:hypothetical protein